METEIDFENNECELFTKNCNSIFDFNAKIAMDIPPILKTVHTFEVDKGFKVEFEYQKALEFLQNEGYNVKVKDLKWKFNSLFDNTDIDFYQTVKTLNNKAFFTYYVEEDGKEISVLTKFKQILNEKFK